MCQIQKKITDDVQKTSHLFDVFNASYGNIWKLVKTSSNTKVNYLKIFNITKYLLLVNKVSIVFFS